MESSWPDWKYPTWRRLGGQITPEGWLKGRREDDGAEGLWRVHNGLYDLSSWIHSHPGGSQWLDVTKGTDITEAFEAHHVGPLPPKILTNFFVRAARTPRNSPFSFKPDGFYCILKSRIYEKLKYVKPGPSTHSKRQLETLATSVFALSVLAAVYHSFLLRTLAGILLTLTTICAHNFFHMRDNWRMYLFNLSLLVVRHWRISHALSHHLFPNTYHDLEISVVEPMLMYLPKSDQSKLFRIISVLYSPFIYTFYFILETVKRTMLSSPHTQDLIGLLLPLSMIVIARVPLVNALLTWLHIIMVSSFLFALMGVTAAHHHPEIFHQGDKPREDRDWGLHCLDVTRDRVEIHGSPSLVLVTFGDHTLHHLFPTVDHAHLHTLYPVMKKTCKEFGIDFKMTTTWNLIIGHFCQLLRNEPNLKERSL